MTLWWNPLKFTMQAYRGGRKQSNVQCDEMRKMKGDKLEKKTSQRNMSCSDVFLRSELLMWTGADPPRKLLDFAQQLSVFERGAE